MFSDEQVLNSFLEDIDGRIKHSCGKDAMRVKNEIRLFLLAQKELTGLPMEKVLSNFSNHDSLIDRFRFQAKPAFESKNATAVKIFLIFIVGSVVTVLIGLVIFLKSITPVFEFDAQKGQISLLGDKIKLKNIDNIKYSSSTVKNNRHYHSGILPLGNASEIKVSGTTMNVSLTSDGDQDSLQYECQGEEELQPQGHMENGIYHISFLNAANCSFSFPKERKFEVSIDSGNINLQDVAQDFRLNVKRGNINWIAPSEAVYKAELVVEQGNIGGNLENLNADNPRYKAFLSVESGNITVH